MVRLYLIIIIHFKFGRKKAASHFNKIETGRRF